MASALYRLGTLAYRRWPAFLVGWLVALVAIGGIASAISKPMSDQITIPGIESLQAQELQEELFPGGQTSSFDAATATVVVAAPEGRTLAEPEYAKAVTALTERLAAVPQQADDVQIVGPVEAAAGLEQQVLEQARRDGTPEEVARANAAAVSPLSADGRIGTMTWDFDVDSVLDVEQSTRDAVEAELQTAREAGLTAEVGGSAMQGMPEIGLTSEAIGIAIALVVLVITFGSLVAAGLPILTAIVGVGIGALGVTAATAFVDLPTTTPILATMLGLAVGIDYALFILSRYRTELHHTDDRVEAMGMALGRAGSAVVFAGLTVIIALVALAVVDIPFLTYMGLAAAGTVLVAVLVALTLLPAILGMLGRRAFAGRVRADHLVDEGEGIVNTGTRWARLLGRAPAVAAIVVVLGLGALAVPASNLHLGMPTDATASSETTQRKAADLTTEGFGEGYDARMLAVVDARGLEPQAAQAAVGQLVQAASGLAGVTNAQIVGATEDGTGYQLLVTPETGPSDEATQDLLTELRSTMAEQGEATGTTIGVTGLTAINVDVSERLNDALVPYLLVVGGLAFVLLMLVFRSVLVPLTATIGFLLTIGATLGATVLVFQEELFGLFEGAPLVSFLPLLLIGISFGLAMDYQVFLVTRMREAYVHGDTAREAVVDGFRHGARVVTAAALIMIAVFAAFVAQPDNLIKSMGFALAAAILIDAFAVRMLLIPSLMYLLGDKAWWLPRWLDRVLPNVDVEGESLARGGTTKGDEVTPSSAEEYVPQHAR